MKHARVMFALLCAVALSPAQGAPSQKVIVDQLDKVLVKFSSDQKTLSPAERRRLEDFVREKYGAEILAAVKKILDAADADRSGALTLEEWNRFRQGASGAMDPNLARLEMVPMRDGTRLATYVSLPDSNGAFPVVLMRTPYRARFAARAGYVNIQQDMRGRFASEGENMPFGACGWGREQDGVDTLAWIRKQAWCNGRIGTTGASACGITQNMMAAAGVQVEAQYIAVAAASLYDQATWVGGALRKCQVEGWLTGNKYDPKALALFREHPFYDELWRDYDTTTRFHLMESPAIHVGGWFDTFVQGTIDSFLGRRKLGNPKSRASQKLVIGPWAHNIAPADGKCGELVFPNSAMPAAYTESRWFDHYLRGASNGIDQAKPVAYFAMGDVVQAGAPGNEWRFVDDWPPASKPAAWYLGARRLGVAAPLGNAEPDSLVFDPANPCPTVGGRNLGIARGPMDQGRVEKRADFLVYDSEVLAEPLEVTGRITARIFVSTSARDTDVSVRLCDVYPDGRSILIADGIQRLRMAAGRDRAQPIEAGKVYEANVDLWSTSMVWNRGHRLRVGITASNDPRFDVNPGTGGLYSNGCPLVVQTNRIHRGAATASCILLPVAMAR